MVITDTELDKKRFSLHSTFAGCPIYWQNFIRFLQGKKGLWGRDVSISVIQHELKQYGGRYHMDGSESFPYIEFNTPNQFVLFALRWS